MTIYSTTLTHPERGYVVGLIDYLDPTHSVAKHCANETERNDAIRSLLADYDATQLIVLGSQGREYRVHADNSNAIAVERMF
jgi:hypothetical protein